MLSYQVLYNGFFEVIQNTNKYSEDLQYVSQRYENIFKNFYLQQAMPISGLANPNLFSSLQNFKLGLISSMKSQSIKTQLEILVRDLHLGICTGVNMLGVYSTVPPSVPLRLESCLNPDYSIQMVSNLLASSIFNWVLLTYSIHNISGAIVKWV